MANDNVITYKCDMCHSGAPDDQYFAMNLYYGYCNKPECEIKAINQMHQDKREELYYAMDDGDLEGAEDAIGDEDIFDVI